MTTAPTNSPAPPQTESASARAASARGKERGGRGGAPHATRRTAQPVASALPLSPESRLWRSFQQLPRAIRWATCGGASIVLLLLYSDYVLGTASNWNAAAQLRLDALAKARAVAGSGLLVDSQLGKVIEAIGPAEAPAGEADTSAALRRAVIEVVKKHAVTKDSFQTGTPGKLKRGTMERIVQAQGGEARYVSGSLEFEATPEVAMKIISELESRPEVEAITSLRINRLSSRDALKKVNVRIQVESWVIDSAPKGATR